MSNPTVTFGDPEVQVCPFAAYTTLQKEAPVYFDPMAKVFIVTRYDDVKAIIMDHARFSNDTGMIQTTSNEEVIKLYKAKGWLPVSTLVNNDPPSHRFYRSLIESAFSAKRVASLEEYISHRTKGLIDAFINRQDEVEFVRALALPLPLQLIMDLVGVPSDRLDDMYRWADASGEATNPMLTQERLLELVDVTIEMQHYFAGLIEIFRKQPADNLLSDLIHADVDGRKLNMTELLSLLQIIITAGYDTTTSALGSAIAGLCDNPELQDELRGDTKKIDLYTTEILRLFSPLQGLFRRAVEDVEIDGVKIPAGSIVNPRWAAANRDANKFAEPEKLDLCRKNAKEHLTFGTGIHFCVGRLVARAELHIAVEQLLDRTRNIRYARGDRAQSWQHKVHFVTWGPQTLYIQFDRP